MNIRMSAILGPFLETIVSCFPIPIMTAFRCVIRIPNVNFLGIYSVTLTVYCRWTESSVKFLNSMSI